VPIDSKSIFSISKAYLYSHTSYLVKSRYRQVEGKVMGVALTEETNVAIIEVGSLNNQPQTSEDIKQPSLNKQFDKLLIEAIDEAMTSLGAPVKNEFYLKLEINFNMEKEAIPQRLEEFSNILHKIFGLGACRLEIKFLKNLESKTFSENKSDYNVSVWIEREMSLVKSVADKKQDFISKSA
jgi:hypothetical protein